MFSANAATIAGSASISGTSIVSLSANTVATTALSNVSANGDLFQMNGSLIYNSGTKTGLKFFGVNYTDAPTSGLSKTLWEYVENDVTKFSFTINEFTEITETTKQNSVHLIGIGTLSGFGFGDNVYATVDLLAGGTFGTQLTINEATTVPLPAAGWLFGSALIGVATIGRRKKREELA